MELSNPSVKKVWNEVSSLSSNAYLGLVDSGKFYNFGAGPCHGGFQTYQVLNNLGFKARNIQELWSKLQPLTSNAKGLDDIYYPWLVNESPWAEAFIEKDFNVIKKVGFNLRADLSSDYVASACVATRFLTENYSSYQCWIDERLPLYKECLKRKEDLFWSFILTNLFKPHKGVDLKGVWSFREASGHNLIPVGLKINQLFNLRNHIFLKSQSFAEKAGYTNTSTAWETPCKLGDTFVSAFAKSWGDKKSTESLNIFLKPNNGENGFPMLDLEGIFNTVLPNLKGLINEK